MNLASWIILLIVIGVVALAAKATFSKKRRTKGCCSQCKNCPQQIQLQRKIGHLSSQDKCPIFEKVDS